MLRKLPDKLQFGVPLPADAGPFAQTIVSSECRGEGSREVRDTAQCEESHGKLLFPWGSGRGASESSFRGRRVAHPWENPWAVDWEPRRGTIVSVPTLPPPEQPALGPRLPRQRGFRSERLLLENTAETPPPAKQCNARPCFRACAETPRHRAAGRRRVLGGRGGRDLRMRLAAQPLPPVPPLAPAV